ncbi:MAG: hypothetical protein ACI8PP_001051 [Candidatus Pseudothioglobus sp.]|jgi:hypothetical protein
MVTASENSLGVPDAVKRSKTGFYGAAKHALLAALDWLRIKLMSAAARAEIALRVDRRPTF